MYLRRLQAKGWREESNFRPAKNIGSLAEMIYNQRKGSSMALRRSAALSLRRVPPAPLAWLLEPSNPSVRHLALRDLLDRPESDSEAHAARQSIMRTGPVPIILAKQRRGGFWGVEEDFYVRSKYKGTVWTFILLAELGANGRDPRIRDTCEFLFTWSQDRTSGGSPTGAQKNSAASRRASYRASPAI